MTTDLNAQVEASQRMAALNVAQQKLGPSATIEELLAEASKIFDWMKTGQMPAKG